MFSFRGKVAVVTGGATGIGAECVRELFKMGVDRCAIFDVDAKKAEETMKKVDEKYRNQVKFFKCDVSKMTEFDNAMKKTKETFKNIDILINNAAVCDERNWERMIEVNLNGTTNGTILGMKYMGKNNGGQGGTIVNVCSVAGLSFSAGFPVYSSTQYGVMGMSRSFAAPYHYEKTGVRIMVTCTGFTDTDFFTKYADTTNKDLMQEQHKEMNFFPVQKTFHVSQALMTVMTHGKNDSVWVCEGGQEPYEVFKPNRIELRNDVRM